MSSERSNKSSTGTLRRVTRSQTTTANNDNTQTNKTNLENEKNIALETYGPTPVKSNNGTSTTETNKNIENTTVITTTIDITDKDIIMGNTHNTEETIQNSLSSSLPAITTPHENLAHSIHASDKGKNVLHRTNTNHNNRNSFNTLFQTPTNVDHHTTYEQTPINDDFNDANNFTSISDTENLDIQDNTNTYLSFALLNDFPYNTLHEIKMEILRHFLNGDNFKGFMGIQNYYGIKIVKIGFYEEAEHNSIHNIYISKLKTCFYNYEPQYLEQIITPILEARYNKTIKIVDIPKHIDNSIIIETISKEIGPIIYSYEPKSFNSKQNDKSSSRKPRPSFFKQLKIEFENQSAVQKIIDEDIWAITVGDFAIRILPNESKSIGYVERTSHQYKLTGLPINSTLKSLHQLLHKIHAKTCTFVPTDKRRLTKSAYVYVAKKDFISKNKTLNINNHNIYIMNPKLKHCTVCSSPSHDFKTCSANVGNTANNQSQDSNNRLTVSQFNTKFRSLIQTPLNNSNQQKRVRQPINNRNLKSNPTPNNRNQIPPHNDNILQQLLKENAELKSLLEQSLQKSNVLQTVQKEITEIKKNILDNKEKISQTNTKVDIILNRTDELNQNILAIQPTNEHNTTYRRKKEKFTSSSATNQPNKFNFNPQIDFFSDIGSLQTIESLANTNNYNKDATTNKYSFSITPPKHLINEHKSEYMENINYEDSSAPTDNLQDIYDTSNNHTSQSISQWNFNPLRKWTS
ncbi:hypothetical protein C1645_864985 [Glomus cerebriforme]|uniref:Uncharacterized protein n=1 Tax=Glomus cerebriforme TaxID=658196 RepID=A0A397S603_9GLOM|nr:hypothetical protein C1645_864985 [Glomus cerebriforme]